MKETKSSARHAFDPGDPGNESGACSKCEWPESDPIHLLPDYDPAEAITKASRSFDRKPTAGAMRAANRLADWMLRIKLVSAVTSSIREEWAEIIDHEVTDQHFAGREAMELLERARDAILYGSIMSRIALSDEIQAALAKARGEEPPR